MHKDDTVDAGHLPLDMGLDPLAVSEPVLSASERVILDERPAEEFFEVPRIGVAHTDKGFSQRLAELYRRVLTAALSGLGTSGGGAGGNGGGVLLDLCSSSDSHLPAEIRPGKVIGHGMNSEELAANAALSSHFTQDLNSCTRLPLQAASVHAVLCCNGLQYLTRPEWVMAEVRRVLLPGGLVLVAFSDCCWAERATAAWLARSNGRERLCLVASILESAGLEVMEVIINDSDKVDGVGGHPGACDGVLGHGAAADAIAGVAGNAVAAAASSGGAAGDPLFAVVARKPAVDSECTGGGAAADRSSSSLGAVTGVAAVVDPAEVAKLYVGPTLQEIDLRSLDVSPAVLERWMISYSVLIEDAKELGIPDGAIPKLPANSTVEDIRAARDHLRALIASFLSAGL